ncbi:MAG: META domain-containing protein [Pseudomonadota bacterium]
MTLRLLFIVLLLSGCLRDETISGYAPEGAIFALQSIDDQPFTTTATISFPAQGRITGQAPCNSYAAMQTVPYPWFNAQAILSSKRACPDLATEQSFFAALSDMTLSEVSGTTLILSNDAGRKMVFTARN